MSELKFCLVAVFCLSFASCGEHFFPQFKVENSFIEDQKVVVVFSANVCASSIKDNFYLTEDGDTVNGEFSFEGRKVTFTPVNGITQNHRYEVLIYTGAEDHNGNSLEVEYKKTFYTKDDLSRPTVLHVQKIIDEHGKTKSLKIEFSKKMNENSFAENFSIEPAAEFITKWNDDGNVVEILFKNDLAEKTFYAIRLDTGAKDALNNFFAKEFTWSFENLPDYTTPEYTVKTFNCDTESWEEVFSVAESLDFSKGIEVTFNKKIDSDKFSQNIFIEPEISYKLDIPLDEQSNFSDRVKICFTESPLWNTEYRLFISKNITDSYGTAVEEKSFLLKNNSEKLRPPKFEFLMTKIGDEYKTLSHTNNFCDWSFAPEIYQPTFEYQLPLYFIFSINDYSETIDEISAIKAISVTTQNSCANITLTSLNIYQDLFAQNADDSLFQIAMTQAVKTANIENKKLVCVQFDSQFYNNENDKRIIQGLIYFKIDKTLCDNNKNYMEESVQLCCNKM